MLSAFLNRVEEQKDFIFNNLCENCFKRESIFVSYSLIKNFRKFDIC
jgi:hypothetical protein